MAIPHWPLQVLGVSNESRLVSSFHERARPQFSLPHGLTEFLALKQADRGSRFQDTVLWFKGAESTGAIVANWNERKRTEEPNTFTE